MCGSDAVPTIRQKIRAKKLMKGVQLNAPWALENGSTWLTGWPMAGRIAATLSFFSSSRIDCSACP